MAANPQCPRDPFVMRQLTTQMNLARVLEIEVSSATCNLKDIKFQQLRGTILGGSTPLLLACEEGHLDSVKRIVDVWGTSVLTAGDFYRTYGENIRGATPLFVAALKGHIEIVRYLIRRNADVSAITSTTEGDPKRGGLTPLHGALMEISSGEPFSDTCVERNIIARLLLEAGANPSTLATDGTPVWALPFCRVDVIIALFNHGLNVNQPSPFRQILHHWIELPSSSCDLVDGTTEEVRWRVVQLLLGHGADLNARDYKGFSPILTAANFQRFDILELLLEKNEIDIFEKIDALELVGARLLLSFEPEKAFHYWRKALLLRVKKEHDLIGKIQLEMTSQRAAEWITLDDLETVKKDSSTHWIQAMTTLLRINADRGCEAVQHFVSEFTPFLLLRNGYRQEEKKLTRTDVQIQDLMLEILQLFLRYKPFGPKLMKQTEYLVFEISDSFQTLKMDKPLLNSELIRIKTSLQLISEAYPDDRSIRLGYSFFAMLARLPVVFLRKNIIKYASQSARLESGTLLARACDIEDWKTLRFLLRLGADPKSTYGIYGYSEIGPLHVVAGRKEDPIRTDVANLLFDYGAQPFRINLKGKTAVDIWTEKNCGGLGVRSLAWNHRPYWCRNTVPKLSCLACKTIHTNFISYNKLPAILQTFVQDH